MAVEVELKFLIEHKNASGFISNLLKEAGIAFKRDVKQLSNCYFDTPDGQLRKADIGLRIRRNKDQLEQTVKTAGKVVGGLHQRPEYNVAISKNTPDLSLFPNDIWPANLAIDEIQGQLVSLFSTDFTRQIWLISFDDGDQVELAFDAGTISANSQEEVISELELELIAGDSQRLLELAYMLTANAPLRQSTRSKAARGYALAKGGVAPAVRNRNMLVPLQVDSSIGFSCVTGLQYVIANIQLTIEAYLAEPLLATLTQLTDYLALIRHGLWLYKDYLPEELVERIQANLKWSLHKLKWVEPAIQINELTLKTGYYRKKIEYSQSLVKQLKLERRRLPDLTKLGKMFYSENFNHLLLDLMQLMLLEQDLSNAKEDDNTLYPFACNWLDQSLQVLQQAMGGESELSAETYLAEHRTLVRSLLTGFWFGGLFDSEARESFRNPWFDLKQGIDELETLDFLAKQIELLPKNDDEQNDDEQEQPEKLAAWLNAKIATLMVAMEQCRQAGLKITPYWH